MAIRPTSRTLTIDFVGEPSRIDELTSEFTTTFNFINSDGPVDGEIGDPTAIDSFGLFPAYGSDDSFFTDMGNGCATTINASGMTGDFYINLSEANGGNTGFDYIGGAGDDTTIFGHSLSTDAGAADGGGGNNVAVLWDDESAEFYYGAPALVNYQQVLFTESIGANGSDFIDARNFGTANQTIVFADGLLGSITVGNVDTLPSGTIFSFEDEEALGFADDDLGGFQAAAGRGNTLNLTTLVAGAAAAVTVHFDDFQLFTDAITFSGGDIDQMNFGGDGLIGQSVTFDGGMDDLDTITASGNNFFQLFSTGSLASLTTIDGTDDVDTPGIDPNTAGISMQDAAVSVTSAADHTAVSDIVSEVLGLTLRGGSGGDTLIGSAGIDAIDGNNGDDVLFGNAGADVINGGGGNDQVQGGDGIDTIHGNTGDDLLVGGDGGDVVFGDEDEDTLYGWAGADNLNGGTQNDLVKGGGGADTVRGGLGVDEHWGDRDVADANNSAGLAGSPQSTTVTITGAEVGETFTVTVNGYGALPNILVTVLATTAVNEDVALALETALQAAGLPAGLVTTNGAGVLTITGQDNEDTFAVGSSQTTTPSTGSITFTSAADLGAVIEVDINGASQFVTVTDLTLTPTQLADFVFSQLVAPAGVTLSHTAGSAVITASSATTLTAFDATDSAGGAAYIDLNVSDFEDNEQISVIIDGVTYSAGGAGITAADAIEALVDSINLGS